jgi:predicted HicB family RNase H-like nuclease
MPVSEAKRRANDKYDAKTYERLSVKVKKGQREEIQTFAKAQGESVNGLINRLIKEAMNSSSS